MNLCYQNINITYMQQIDKENIVKLSKKIKALRLKQSKSLNKFVLSNGYLTTATWSRLENGLNDYKFSTLLRVSRLLNIKIDELLKDINFNYDFKDD